MKKMKGKEGWRRRKQEVGKIIKNSVRKALKRVKNGEKDGPSFILVEVWKYLGERAVDF